MRQFIPVINVMHYGVVSGTGTHDLTEWLGDGCVVRTSKNLRAPMGQFTITFVDKEYPGFLDSVYYLFAPMDAVEIRIAHDGSKAPKLVMRGFVSDVRRDESMGQDGKPSRRVTVIGHDIGKLLLQHQIHMLPTAEEVQKQITGWGVLLKYFGSASKTISASEYVTIMVGIIQSHLDVLLAGNELSGLSIFPKPDVEGLIPPIVLNSLNDVSYHAHMTRLLDVGPWNEMFTRDDETGCDFIVRENFTQEDGITITEQDVQSMSSSRTDANVSNWYWARISRAQLYDQATAHIQAARTSSYDLRGFEPCSEARYGWRKMEADASLFPDGHGLQDDGKEGQYIANQNALYPWLTQRQAKLVANNVYNAMLEDSVLRIQGNEDVSHGTWLTLNKGDTVQRHYIVGVDHEFQIYGNYITTLRCERGDGYMSRMGGGGYKSELNLGGAQK